MKNEKDEKIGNKKNGGSAKIIGIIGIFLIVSFLTVAGLNILNKGTVNSNLTTTTTTLKETAATDVQVVNLYFKNGNYYPNTIRVKKDIPVKIIVDTNTVQGCMKTIVIPKLNIRKTITNSDNVIEFTPGIPGAIPFTCGMGMGTGTIIVEDNSLGNSAANFALDTTTTIDETQQQNNLGTCGAGGCGSSANTGGSSCGSGGSCGCGCGG